MIFFVIQEVRPYVRKVFRGVQSALLFWVIQKNEKEIDENRSRTTRKKKRRNVKS